MVKIAFITETNPIWMMKPLEDSIDLLKKNGHLIVGIVETPAILSKLRGIKVKSWYLNTFGLIDFIKLGIFAFNRILKRILISKNKCLTFKKLAKLKNTQYLKCKTPNSEEVIKWIKTNKIDIVISQTSFLLNKTILSIPNLGLINKHAAILPANKGLFPYIWAYKNNLPQGVSYHLMEEMIDEGPLLHQEVFSINKYNGSMIKFYCHVFNQFPKDIVKAVKILLDKKYINPIIELKSSYQSLPDKKDIKLFRKNGGRIIDWIDIFKDLFT